MTVQRLIFVAMVLVLPGLCITGCASYKYKPAPGTFQPQIQRALIQTNGPIVASVAVLSRKEAEKKFGLPLHKKDIQPVWIRLENTGSNSYYFLPVGLDSDYHPASEVAYMYRKFLAGKYNRRVSEVMQSNAIPLLLAAGSTNTGFIFANYDPGAKHVQVDVMGEREHYRLEFSVPVPGKRLDYQRVDFKALYETNEFQDYTLDEFRHAIESLPAETTDKRARGRGDPLNLVVVADESNQIGVAFLRNGWDVTEVLTFWNGMKLVNSFIFHSHWRTSPVSALYVFGRKQDLALQKARSTIHQRNHLRLWLAPFTCEGHYVFVGQISRDIGLRFTFKAPGFFTHKIDPDTDEARDCLAQEMVLSGTVNRVAWVGGVGEHTPENPGRNLTWDPWWTDGNRVVLFLTREETDPDEIHLSDWRHLKAAANAEDPQESGSNQQ